MSISASKNLAPKAKAAASLLRRAGAKDGQVVAAVTGSPSVLCVLAYAATTLEAPLFPLDPSLPHLVIEDLLDQTGATLVVSDRPLGNRTVVQPRDILEAAADCAPTMRQADDRIALILATSGSSGRPKAVMLTAGNLRAAARASATRTPLGPHDRWLMCLPPFHIGGFSVLTRCAYAGAQAIVHEGFDPRSVLASLETDVITHISLVPAMLAQLLDASADPPPSTLRHALVGGAALSSALAERAMERGWPIQPTYGMSETASQIATLPALTRPWRQGTVGRALPGIELALAADGRLRVRGPMVMAGYANPRLHPGDGLDDGWFVTSDLARIDADGTLTILGRSDDVIVSGGKKVLPALVEDALAGCPGVDAVGIVGRQDAVWGEVVTAVYRGDAVPDEVLAWCRGHVAGALRPRAAVRVAALPLLANGKSDRLALRRLVEGNAAESGPVAENQGSVAQ